MKLFKKMLFPIFLLVFSAMPAFADDLDPGPEIQDTSVISSSLSGAIQHAIGNPLASTQTVTPALEEVVPVTTTTTSLTTETFPFTTFVPVTTTTQIQTGTGQEMFFMHDSPLITNFLSTSQTMTTSQLQSLIPLNASVFGFNKINNQYFLPVAGQLNDSACATACIPASAYTILTPTGRSVGVINGGTTVYSFDVNIPMRESIQVTYNTSTNKFSQAPADHDYTGKMVNFYSTTNSNLSSQQNAAFQAGYKFYGGVQQVTPVFQGYPIANIVTPTGTIQPTAFTRETSAAWSASAIVTTVPIYSTSTSTSFKPVTTTSTETIPITTSITTFKTVFIPLKNSQIHLSASSFTTSTIVGPPILTKNTLIKSAPVVAPLSTRWNSLPGPGSPTLLQLSPWSNPISLVASLAIGAVLHGHAKSVWFGQIAKNHPFMGRRSLHAPAPAHVSHHQKTSIIHHI